MAPHKAKARGHQPPPQPPPQPSDYETDAPPPALIIPLPPPRSNEELNHSVLKRTYPELAAIEHVTPFAALYVFSLETQIWEKVGVEGTLFICRLTPSDIGTERFCVVILNRKGLDNFYLELTSSNDMEIDDPYIILQGDEIYGLWIFADPPPATTANCRVECAQKMMEIADRAQASRKAKEGTGKNGVDHTAEQTEPALSEPMGRQLSLRQLFGQQREQDASFSGVEYIDHPPAHAPTQQQLYNPGPAQQDVLADDHEGLEVNEMGERHDSQQADRCLETQMVRCTDRLKESSRQINALPCSTSESPASRFTDGFEQRRAVDAITWWRGKQPVQTDKPRKHSHTAKHLESPETHRRPNIENSAKSLRSSDGIYYHHLSGTLWKEVQRTTKIFPDALLETDELQVQLQPPLPRSETY